jgi:IPT/TIG domain
MEVEDALIADIDIIDRAGRSNTSLTIDTPVAVADGFLTIKGISNEPKIENAKISAIEVVVIGPHYTHAVTGGPYEAVDTDKDGFENVPVDASESHTHGPNEVLKTFVWKRGNVIIGNGEVSSLFLPIGQHTVTLTVTDSSGDQNTDTTTITVRTAEFPSLTSISPNSGFLGGGTQVTITGSGFDTVFGVRFGQVVLSSLDITIVNSTTIVVVSPFSGVSVPAAVSVINPAGESNSRRFTYLSTIPIRFSSARLLGIDNPAAVAFGPDSKLYVGNLKGQLGKYTLNENFDVVLSSVIATINPNRGIHGIAFDPLDDADTLNPTVYISTSDIYHNEARNSIGDAVNGKIQTVRGANLDIVSDLVTGLPVSGSDHSVRARIFKFLYFDPILTVLVCNFKRIRLMAYISVRFIEALR